MRRQASCPTCSGRNRVPPARGARPLSGPRALGVFARPRRSPGCSSPSAPRPPAAPSCAPTAATRSRFMRAEQARLRRAAEPSSPPCDARSTRRPSAEPPAATPWSRRCARSAATCSPPAAGLEAVTGPAIQVVTLDDAPRRSHAARRRHARRPRRPPAGRAGRGQRAVARRRGGDDAHGPAGHLDQRGPLRRATPSSCRVGSTPRPTGSPPSATRPRLRPALGGLGRDPDLPGVRRRVFGLGWTRRRAGRDARSPAYTGPLDLRYATPVRDRAASAALGVAVRRRRSPLVVLASPSGRRSAAPPDDRADARVDRRRKRQR